MRILWDDDKNRKLIIERGVSFEEAASCILEGKIIDIVKHLSRPGQFYFVITLNEYVHVVPFVLDKNKAIILKTIFPSRKYHKKYGRKNEKKI